jgi:hypothetical protein
LGAGDAGLWCLNEEWGAALFDGALEAVPLLRGDAAEVAFVGVAQVEDEEAEVGVAREEVGDLESGGGVLGADPDEVFEPGGRPRRGIKGVGRIDQRDAEILGACVAEELAEEELRSATGSGADDFGEGAFGEAAGGVIERGPAGGQRGGRCARRGGKTLGEELPQCGKICRGAGHGDVAWACEEKSRKRGRQECGGDGELSAKTRRGCRDDRRAFENRAYRAHGTYGSDRIRDRALRDGWAEVVDDGVGDASSRVVESGAEAPQSKTEAEN